jgi:hypothetical protein
VKDPAEPEEVETAPIARETPVWWSQGECVGWLATFTRYLLPVAVLPAARRAAGSMDATVAFTDRSLGDCMYVRMLLLMEDRVGPVA